MTLPRLLLVEDDPVSACFLGDALRGLPAEIDCAPDLHMATQFAACGEHALWLVDANLPDGSGADWLRTQRHAGRHCQALALTAENERARLDALFATGFLDVLQKPIAVAALQAAVRRRLGVFAPSSAVATGKLPIWDETQALRALAGDRGAWASLRGLFLQELPGQRDAVLDALDRDDATAACAALHRLKAGTAFVGAARLAEAVHALSAAPQSPALRLQFEAALSDQLDPASAAGPDPPSMPRP